MNLNFWAVFESAPDAYLLLAPDSPRFTMVAANKARLAATMSDEKTIIGHSLFEVFPDNPDDPAATGVRNLRASLEEVIRSRKPHRMALQKYDIRRPDGSFEERYWDPLNSPVFDEQGKLIYIIHRVEDVTDQVMTGRRVKEAESLLSKLRESEEQYRLLADMVPQHIWTADPDGHITYASRRWYEFTGNTPEQSLGEAWIETLHPDDRAATLAAWKHSLRTGEPLSAEYRFRKFTGEYAWFLGKAVPERDAQGKITRWFGTLTDISEKKKFEESFRVLANTIPQLAWMADESGSIFWYNDRWMEYTGSTLDEMRGWGWEKVHHPDHVSRVVAKIRHSFETGEPWEDTFPLRGRDGTYRWFLSRATPIRDASRKVTRWFGTNTDVTDQMEASAERERVTESRTRLMRGFSHDLKNPLGAADGFAALLEDGVLGELTDKQRESVHRIRRSIQASLRLIQELLELARAEAGEIDVDCVQVNVSTIACEAADDVRAQATTKHLSLDLQVPDGLQANTDSARVRQVLSNLLSNAVKYTDQGGVTVAAKADRERRRIAVIVTDTGPGIPLDKQETIFQEFTRLDPDAKPGAGIGLAISRRIARLLSGDITVTSEPGRGSTFTLWLPDASQPTP